MAIYLGAPYGGVETTMTSLARWLPKYGWNAVLLINGARCGSLADQLRPSRVEVVVLPFSGSRDPQGVRLVAEAVTRSGASIYLPTYQFAPHEAIRLLDSSRIATVLIANGTHSAYLETLRPYLRYAAKVVSVSRLGRELLRSESRRHRLDIDYIPSGIEPPVSAMRAPNSDFTLLHHGRLVRTVKRADRYLSVANELHRRRTRFRLRLVGDGDVADEFRSIRKVGPAALPNVDLIDPLPPHQMSDYLATSDVFLLLSESEGLSISLLEAMSYGLVPIVTSANGWHDGILEDGLNGHIVHDGEISKIVARLVEELSCNRDRLAELSQAAASTARRFTMDRMARAYARLFDECQEQLAKKKGWTDCHEAR